MASGGVASIVCSMSLTQDQTGTAGTLKTCTRCLQPLPFTAFRADRSKPDGRYPQCRLCFGSVASIFKVIHWHPCRHCGKYFKPRHNKRQFVRHCTRTCAAAALRGANHHNWQGDAIGYGAAHYRVRQVRGRPAQCAQCGTTKGGMHWALDHGRCESPLHSAEGPYSPDPNDYLPLCVPCHKTMDLDRFEVAA